MSTSSIVNLTEGNVFKKLAIFAIPFLAANFVQALYGAADMAIVGFFTNSAGIASVSIGSQVMQILNSMIVGLAMGGTILIAQYVGADRPDEIHHTVRTVFTMFAIAAVAFTVIMLLATRPILLLLNTPPEAFEEAIRYVFICSCGIIFIFGYNAVSAILRAMGDSRNPLVFIIVACVCNIALDILFIGPLGMGAGGAALATVLAQGVSLLLAVLHLRRIGFTYFDFAPSSFRIYPDKLRQILRLGLPVSLQESILCVSFLFIAAITNQLGLEAAAAVGICNRFEAFAMLPATAAAGAVSAIAAQNMGAGNHRRALQSLYASILLSFVASIFFFGWAQLAPNSIMYMFGAEEILLIPGAQYLKSFSYDFMLVALGFTTNGFLNGCGRTGFAMINGVAASVLVRLPLAWLLTNRLGAGLFAIGYAAPIATACSVTAALLYIRTGRWRQSVIDN